MDCVQGIKKNDVRISLENVDLHALSLDYPDLGDTLILVSKVNLEPKEYYIVKGVQTSIEDWKVVVTLNKEIEFDVNDFI